MRGCASGHGIACHVVREDLLRAFGSGRGPVRSEPDAGRGSGLADGVEDARLDGRLEIVAADRRHSFEPADRNADFPHPVWKRLDRWERSVVGAGDGQAGPAQVDAERSCARVATEHERAAAGGGSLLCRDAHRRSRCDQAAQRLALAAMPVQGRDFHCRKRPIPDRQFVDLSAQSVWATAMRVADQHESRLGDDANSARGHLTAVDVEPCRPRRGIACIVRVGHRGSDMHPAALGHRLRGLHGLRSAEECQPTVVQLEHPWLLRRVGVVTGGKDCPRLALVGRGLITDPAGDREGPRSKVSLQTVEVLRLADICRFAGRAIDQPLPGFPVGVAQRDVAGVIPPTVVVRPVETPVVDQPVHDLRLSVGCGDRRAGDRHHEAGKAGKTSQPGHHQHHTLCERPARLLRVHGHVRLRCAFPRTIPTPPELIHYPAASAIDGSGMCRDSGRDGRGWSAKPRP